MADNMEQNEEVENSAPFKFEKPEQLQHIESLILDVLTQVEQMTLAAAQKLTDLSIEGNKAINQYKELDKQFLILENGRQEQIQSFHEEQLNEDIKCGYYKQYTAEIRSQIQTYRQQKDNFSSQRAQIQKKIAEMKQKTNQKISELQQKEDTIEAQYNASFGEHQKQRKQWTAEKQQRLHEFSTKAQQKIQELTSARQQYQQVYEKHKNIPTMLDHAQYALHEERMRYAIEERERKRWDVIVSVTSDGRRQIFKNLEDYKMNAEAVLKQKWGKEFEFFSKSQNSKFQGSIQYQMKQIQFHFYQKLLKVYENKILQLVRERDQIPEQLEKLQKQVDKILAQEDPKKFLFNQSYIITLQGKLQIAIEEHQVWLNQSQAQRDCSTTHQQKRSGQMSPASLLYQDDQTSPSPKNVQSFRRQRLGDFKIQSQSRQTVVQVQKDSQVQKEEEIDAEARKLKETIQSKQLKLRQMKFRACSSMVSERK